MDARKSGEQGCSPETVVGLSRPPRHSGAVFVTKTSGTDDVFRAWIRQAGELDPNAFERTVMLYEGLAKLCGALQQVRWYWWLDKIFAASGKVRRGIRPH